MARGLGSEWGTPPKWAWVVLVIGAVGLAVLLPLALHRPAPPGFDPPPVAAGLAGGAATSTPVPTRAPTPMPTPTATPTPTPTPARPGITVPQNPRLLILGDSYTQGYAAADPASQGWAQLVGARLGWRFIVDGAPGTGFTNPGPGGVDRTFGARLRNDVAQVDVQPNVLILQGGQGDTDATPAAVRAAVAGVVRQAQAAVPGIQVVVFGPAAPQPFASQLGAVDDAIGAGAADAAVPYISPVDGDWFTTANSLLFGISDGTHLNSVGHAYLADRFLAAFRALQG